MTTSDSSPSETREPKLTQLKTEHLRWPYKARLTDQEVEWVVDTLNILVERENRRNGHV